MQLYINTKDQKIIQVSLKKGDEVIESKTKENQFGSQVLLPLILELLKNNNIKFEDIKEIEVETGPGSFTGLRVGMAVAQALGFGLNIAVNGSVNKTPQLRYT